MSGVTKIGSATYNMQNREFNRVSITLPSQGDWHLERKKAILKAHPEIAALQRPDPNAAIWAVIFVGLTSFVACYSSHLSWWLQIPLLYTIGVWFSFNCTVLAHEGIHGLIFENRTLNRIFAMFALAPGFMGPMAMFWQTEHIWHHTIVIDKIERFGPMQNNLIKKFVISATLYLAINIGFALLSTIAVVRMLSHMVLYLAGLRKTILPTELKVPPFSRFPQTINFWVLANTIYSHSYMGLMYYLGGWSAVIFLIAANALANGFHPLGMRNVQEHYCVSTKQPTASVYAGVVNALTFNIGYHVEHHDFATIPQSKLPMVTKIAPEFYLDLFHYKSYSEVFVRFFTEHGIPLSVLFADNPVLAKPE